MGERLKPLYRKPEPSKTYMTWDTTQLNPRVFPGDEILRYGVIMEWTASHMKGCDLEPWRQIGDRLADAVVAELQPRPGDDILSSVIQKRNESKACSEFYNQITKIPDWVDWDAIARGQVVFHKYGPVSAIALLYLSLAGGFGAPRINKVLTATGYLANQNAYRRLWETSQMIYDCMEPGSLVPLKGKGWESTLRVRFLHTKVRSKLSSYPIWNSADWGIPINQEDMCATILSFQFNVLYSMKVVGVYPTMQEVNDYTHLWRYIAYLIGVDEDKNPCRSFDLSHAMMESIFLHLVEPDDISSSMTKHVLWSITHRPPTFLGFDVHAEIARAMMGDELADSLQLPRSATKKLFVKFMFMSMRLSCFISGLPIIGAHFIEFNKKKIADEIERGLEGKPATFLMSHIPKSSTIDNLDFKANTESYVKTPPLKQRILQLLISGGFVGFLVYLVSLYSSSRRVQWK